MIKSFSFTFLRVSRNGCNHGCFQRNRVATKAGGVEKAQKQFKMLTSGSKISGQSYQIENIAKSHFFFFNKGWRICAIIFI